MKNGLCLMFGLAGLVKVCGAGERCLPALLSFPLVTGKDERSIWEVYPAQSEHSDNTVDVLRALFPDIADFQELPAEAQMLDQNSIRKALNDPARRQEMSTRQKRVSKQVRDASAISNPNYRALPGEQRDLVESWLQRLNYLDNDNFIANEPSLAVLPLNNPFWTKITDVLNVHPASPLLDLSLVALIPNSEHNFSAKEMMASALHGEPPGSFHLSPSAVEAKFLAQTKNASAKDKKILLAWLRLLEIYDQEIYREVITLADKLPADHPKWEFILDEIKFTMGSQRGRHLVGRAAQRFLTPHSQGGNARNRDRFFRSWDESEMEIATNSGQRRLADGTLSSAADLVDFLRRAEDMNPDFYQKLVSVLSLWKKADPRWQRLCLKVKDAANGESIVADFDLVHDILNAANEK